VWPYKPKMSVTSLSLVRPTRNAKAMSWANAVDLPTGHEGAPSEASAQYDRDHGHKSHFK
jgi:hypothetical protein